MSIERIEESQLRTMNGKEGIILQGTARKASYFRAAAENHRNG